MFYNQIGDFNQNSYCFMYHGKQLNFVNKMQRRKCCSGQRNFRLLNSFFTNFFQHTRLFHRDRPDTRLSIDESVKYTPNFLPIPIVIRFTGLWYICWRCLYGSSMHSKLSIVNTPAIYRFLKQLVLEQACVIV